MSDEYADLEREIVSDPEWDAAWKRGAETSWTAINFAEKHGISIDNLIAVKERFYGNWRALANAIEHYEQAVLLLVHLFCDEVPQ